MVMMKVMKVCESSGLTLVQGSAAVLALERSGSVQPGCWLVEPEV